MITLIAAFIIVMIDITNKCKYYNECVILHLLSIYECNKPLEAMLYSDFTTVKGSLASFIWILVTLFCVLVIFISFLYAYIVLFIFNLGLVILVHWVNLSEILPC